MKRRFLPILFAAACLPLHAQENWSLERCIDYALSHNLDIQLQDNRIAVRQAELAGRRLDYLPSLNLHINHELNWGRSVDMQELVIIRNQLTTATAAAISASAVLFEGLSKHYGRMAAREAVASARYEAQFLREALTIDITHAYLELMLARQIYAYTCESHATIVQQRERTSSLVEAGSQPKSALNEMEAQVASEKAAMVEASCRVRTAVLGLTRLMNLPPDSLFVTDSVFENDSIVPRIPVISADQAEAYIQSDARIRNARSSIREKEYLHAAARSPMLPTLSVAAGYGTYFSSAADDPFRAQLDENRNPSLSFQLGIPIFNGGTVLMQERRQRLAVRASRLEAEKLQAQIRDEIHEAAIEAENCLQKYHSADEALRATNGLLSITEARYNLGAATALDYIIARNHHFKAMSDFLQAKWQYLFQLRMLDRYYR